MRKLITVLFFAGHSLLSQGQHLENKIDLGLGISSHMPVGPTELNHESDFVYPSLFGNYSNGFGGNVDLNYHLSERFRLGIRVEMAHFSSWKGDKRVFLLEDPALSLISFSASGHYLPGFLQWSNPKFRWGLFVAPQLVSQMLKWDENLQEQANQPDHSNSTMHPGFMTGISLFYASGNFIGLRMDVYYQYVKADNVYHLDPSFQALNVSLGVYMKLLQNKYFRYE